MMLRGGASVWCLPMTIWALFVLAGVSTVSARIAEHAKLVTAADSESALEGSYIVLLESLEEFVPPKPDVNSNSIPQTYEEFKQSLEASLSLSKKSRAQEQQAQIDAVIPPMYRKHEYYSVLNGYALRDVPDSVIQQILDSDLVAAVYEDTMVYAGPDIEEEEEADYPITQTGATWGIDRVDSRTGLDGNYNYDYTGANVMVFIIDGGVLATHPEFAGRYMGCTDFSEDQNCVASDHGTHVAGTAVGTTYGVAKGAYVVDFKALSSATGSGFVSDVIAAIDAVARYKINNPSVKTVVNMSLGGLRNNSQNTAARNLVNTGAVVVVAAGNSDANACNYSPSSELSVITVGATTIDDARAYYSNFGSCLDIFAPGSGITSASNTGGTRVLSGTSMASPHVAGIAALFLEEGVDAYAQIRLQSTSGVISDVQGSVNRFAFNGFGITPYPTPPPTPPPPTSAPVSPPVSPEDCFCFSEIATVPVLHKGTVEMPNLSVGDKVLTTEGYQTIYGFAHQGTTSIHTFLRFYTDKRGNRKPLELTGEHLVFIHGKANPVRADSIKVGDLLVLHDDAKGIAVTKITTVDRPGLYAPLTPSGTLVVDGIKASCYVSFQKNAAENVEFRGGISSFLSHHDYVHMLAAPVRIACIGISPKLCQVYNSQGVAYFVQMGFDLTDFIQHQQSMLLQVLLLSVYLVFFGSFLVAEIILGPERAVYALFLGISLVFLKCLSLRRGEQCSGYYESDKKGTRKEKAE